MDVTYCIMKTEISHLLNELGHFNDPWGPKADFPHTLKIILDQQLDNLPA